MMELDRNKFLKSSQAALESILDTLESTPIIDYSTLGPDRTALVVIDMVNGFARKGALMSERVNELVPEIMRISKVCDLLGIPKLFFADSHSENSPEFSCYPMHCRKGSSEAAVVDELRRLGGYKLIEKNSTNGFLEEEFAKWMKDYPKTDCFIVVGDCTDICIQQFATTLKAWFNKKEKKSRVIVPIGGVDTYHMESHDGDLTHVMALYNMKINGIELVK